MFSRVSSQVKGNPLPQLWNPHFRNQGWGIYVNIYHYAPFFLSNPMLKDSKLNSDISSHSTSPSVHFKGKIYINKVGNLWWNPQDHLRIPMTWPSRCFLFIEIVFPQGNTDPGLFIKSAFKASNAPELLG
ncbi:hypothetical protein O181_009173 [Austropuccinia psidii MF-1]|uniref:Uncharacterized protein n=1 Tax=Austropuccinia psidii MF-1 TaxID=1389203 RepID=A0A9Q3BQK6_9BASI|nr:hypothetical protein [Austropuccinia psidii MF-1]